MKRPVELQADEIEYGKLAKQAIADGKNPAEWVADEDLWEKAKGVVDPEGKGAESYDDPYAVTVSVYKKMGGGIKEPEKKESAEARAAKRIVENASLQARIRSGGFSIEDFRQKLSQLVQDISVFKSEPKEGMPMPITYVADVIAPAHEQGEVWEAIVNGSDGKLYCVEFRVGSGQDIKVVGEPRQIERVTDYAYLNEENYARAAQMRCAALAAKAAATSKTVLDCARAGDGAGDIRSIVALENTFMFMPGGLHKITPTQNDKAVTVEVLVNAETAKQLETQRRAMEAGGKKPYFGIGENSHKSDICGFWPHRFFWDKRIDATGSLAEGVWVEGEWTKSGREAVEGKDFRTFSPTFFVDGIRNKPAQVICEAEANANMGAFVNDPAFQIISPLWARNAAGATGELNITTNTGEPMTPEEKAQLQARIKQLENEISARNSKDDAVSKAELKAAQAELREIKSQIELAEAKEKNSALEAAESKRKEKEADAAVARMVAGRGAILIAPRDTEKQTEWRSKFIADPTLIPLMAGDASSAVTNPVAGGRITPSANAQQGQQVDAKRGGVSISADLAGGIRQLAELCARNSKDPVMANKFAAAADIGEIYAREIRPLLARGVTSFPLEAAEAKDTLGTLAASTLVALRTLDLYKFEFPMLDTISTDFSDQPALFNQTTVTRIIVVPAVLSYDATIGADGRPNGYVIVTPAQTVDAPITLDKHRAVDIVFDANCLASTQRRLFEEMGPAAAYALGKDIVDNLYAVITAANFADNPPFSVAAINYGRPTFSKAKRILNLQGVPYTNRFALSSSAYQEMLEQDPTLVSLAVFQKPEIITDSELPMIARFRPIEAPNLPATNIGGKTLQAFFAHKSALLMQARVPNDWNTVLGPGQSYGTVSVVTNPDTGLSALLVQFSNPQSAHAEYRLAIMYGLAKGNSKGGQIVTD